MNTESVVFSGAFTVVGGQINITMKSAFKIKWDVVEPTVNKVGYKEEDPEDISITGVFGSSGTITERIGGFANLPVPGAILTAWKDGFIYDKVKTNDAGEYTMFLPAGVYDIEIDGHNFKRTVKNHQITDGITEVYSLPKAGDIFERYYDATSFLYRDNLTGVVGYHNDWLINGEILDTKDKPVENAEIVVTIDNEVVVYTKTNKEGKYHFMLPLGIYDVIIRLPKQHAKIAKSVSFGGREGFIPNVVQGITAVR